MGFGIWCFGALVLGAWCLVLWCFGALVLGACYLWFVV